jgi:hypothetical protein
VVNKRNGAAPTASTNLPRVNRQNHAWSRPIDRIVRGLKRFICVCASELDRVQPAHGWIRTPARVGSILFELLKNSE